MIKTDDLWTYLATTNKKIVMYGMGNGADKILSVCERYGIEVCDFFASDGFVRGHKFHGKEVLSYSGIKEKYGTENIIVLLSFASSLPDVLENIYKIADECELYAPDVPVCGDTLFTGKLYLKNLDKINTVRELLADEKSKRVFDAIISYKLSGDVKYLRHSHCDFSEVYRDILKAEDFELIADLGAYNGDTIREIKPFCPKLSSAVAFEPDRRSFRKLSEYAQAEDAFKVIPYKLAAWSERREMSFADDGNRNSTLVSDANMAVGKGQKVVEIEANSLDNVLGGQRVDYIKYDVEGAEREAILGSCESIRKHDPALCVSLYHRSEDIWELPLMVREICPDHKLYIRRREYVPAWDTVLLAVREER
jgi:FkbM family methyltransferase